MEQKAPIPSRSPKNRKTLEVIVKILQGKILEGAEAEATLGDVVSAPAPFVALSFRLHLHQVITSQVCSAEIGANRLLKYYRLKAWRTAAIIDASPAVASTTTTRLARLVRFCTGSSRASNWLLARSLFIK